MRRSLWFLTLVLVLSGCRQPPLHEVRDEFGTYFEEYDVEGSFALFDEAANKFLHFNEPQFTQEFIPASTFKVCNSLIALETGVIADEHTVLPWDSAMRPIPEWNRDHDMKSAFRYSTVWFYQELARRIGGERMKHWLDQLGYGNADTAGGIDRFWLDGGLRISPQQQIDFLRRLRNNELPCSHRSMEIVRSIMIAQETPSYTLRAKTGRSGQDDRHIGWYVGYVQKQNGSYFFCTCIQSTGADDDEFARARVAISYKILSDLKIIE